MDCGASKPQACGPREAAVGEEGQALWARGSQSLFAFPPQAAFL